MKAELQLTLGLLQKKAGQPSKFDGIQFRTNPEFGAEVSAPEPPSTQTQHPSSIRPDQPAAAVRPQKRGAPMPANPSETSKVGWMIAILVFAAGSLAIWFVRDLAEVTSEPVLVQEVEIPSVKRKG